MFETIIVPLASMYASLETHRLDFDLIAVVNASRASSFISTQFFALNFDG